MSVAFDRETAMEALTQALPYVRLYRGKVFVIKLGGASTDDAASLRRLVEQVGVLSEFGIRVVLVHGGGAQTTALAERLGVPTKLIDGRRVTSPEVLDLAVMAMNGAVNTALLAACRATGLPAIGVSGIDAGLVLARVRDAVPVDFGEVGDIVSVDRTVIDRLLDAGFLPVVSPLSSTADGRVLNVNADTVASSLASALGAEKLVFVTDTEGLLDDPRDGASTISYLDLEGVDALERRGALRGGIVPKIRAARAALSGGVHRVHLVGHAHPHGLLIEVFTNEGAGTLLVRSRADLSPAEQGGPAVPGVP
ncbi:MAG TPA: acetylglutamate kinase [Candidatus Sulfotelmatobacter sp.]|nr:acetylglutamate kinase [Candidatus Sulfotelmatobacter sp.]